MEPIRISSIIIAKNEEQNIGRCLNSLLSCVDEIIVLVDDSTTDNTLEIIKLFPQVKYEIVKWQGYSKAKQRAVSLTNNDWILWVDADETLSEKLCKEIIKLKNDRPGYSAYSIPRKANFLGRWIEHSGWYPGRVMRLFNKNSAHFSESDVHEHLIVNGKTGGLKNDIEHFTDPSINHYFEKFNIYTSLAAEELYKKGRRFSLSDIIIRPYIFFIKMYFIKRGFLDGIQGFILAVFSSAYVFTKYCKLWELKRNSKGIKV